MPARCDDPNCSCRSPELEMFTNQVLRRDAAKTDYLVIPLIGGVLANCFLAEAEVEGPDYQENSLLDVARSVRDLATAAREGKAWEDETHAYGIIADLVFCNWPEVLSWGSMSWFRAALGLPWQPRPAEELAAALRILKGNPAPSWTESVILASFAAFSVAPRKKTNDYDLLGKAGRPLRVALADRMRRENLVTWPAALAAAVGDWNVPMLQRLSRSQSRAGDAAIHYVMNLEAAEKAKEEEEGQDAPPPPPPSGKHATVGEDKEVAVKLVEDAVADIMRARTERDQVRQQRDQYADRDTRHRSHIESLEREVKSARQEQARLATQVVALQKERDLLAERVAAYEAVSEEAPSSAPAADTFAGRRVMIFTGAESADARNAFAQSFRDLGAAEVDCYQADRSRGPDIFPAESIVAIDVSFMSHSTWNAIVDRARSNGAWCYWGKHGAATLSRATAAAWRAHNARM